MSVPAFTKEERERIKSAVSALVASQMDSLLDSYLDASSGLPEGVADNLSPEQAASLMQRVIDEAQSMLGVSVKKATEQVRKVTQDKDKMDRIRKEFMDSLSGSKAAEAHVTEVRDSMTKEGSDV